VRLLEPLGESPELGRAYSVLSQLAMLEDDTDGALEWGQRALVLAERVGDEATRVHALVNLGSTHLLRDPDATAPLLEAHAAAHAVGERHEAARALINMSFSLTYFVRPAQALDFAQRGLAYGREHEVETL